MNHIHLFLTSSGLSDIRRVTYNFSKKNNVLCPMMEFNFKQEPVLYERTKFGNDKWKNKRCSGNTM